MVSLSRAALFNKVYGGLLGKNAGGSLGTPYERGFGQEDLIDVRLEPKLYPNDDFEVQMAWLRLIEDRGLDVTEHDLAQCWLDCIHYNWDEYGLSKRNLRLGILPPMSGFFNNWFKHCMGSPIRSEVWAMIAPGLPDVAAEYAFKDAIVDHGGGESVYGEVFNAVLESLAFIEGDLIKLIKHALSYIPQNSLTHKAIENALNAYAKGLDLREARRIIIELAPTEYRKIAQYSPINLGFEVLGLLYGNSFMDAIAKTISLGYDTDSTAATVGAVLGIIHGADYIPQDYVKVYEEIMTNETWGGVSNIRSNRTVTELANRILKVTYRLLARYNDRVKINHEGGVEWLIDPFTVKPNESWLNYKPNTWRLRFIGIEATVEHPIGPVLKPNVELPIIITIRSIRLSPINLNYIIHGINTKAYQINPVSGGLFIEPNSTAEVEFRVRLINLNELNTVEHPIIQFTALDSFESINITLTILPPVVWFINKVNDSDEDVDRWVGEAAAGEWAAVYRDGYDLSLEDLIPKGASMVAVGFIYNPGDSRIMHLGIPNNAPYAKLWFNEEPIVESKEKYMLRPNYDGDGRNYADALMRHGWNTVSIKVKRIDEPVSLHFMISESSKNLHRGVTNIIQYKRPSLKTDYDSDEDLKPS
ncbi:ADP-ribosylglycohydrolase family protein [Caldivirga maquilingensis]|uniref:ADP-ribosylation/Crystallin J1 n=1 Tax=Caldivirga maquilingensis (strain ATCC 700844 / DSM 13496 / JCM 10307 / IC-167) TaxID=397948 RepID=A8MCN0_CALMQ|nr:ADP-ribosylglycohydrolase family protein [Caldivirga maquilingensis]ABW01536.1 ADP-ribosylation/Crystallin J1 [Caldivirga maquilingensis IC-167]